MTTRRDRKRFERTVARAMRPSKHSSAVRAASAPRLLRAARSLGSWPALVIMIAAACLVVSYTVLPWVVSRLFDDAQAAKPIAIEGPVQNADERRPVESRDAHLRQLQPVLRAEADKLSELARRARADGRVTDFGKERSDGAQRDLSDDVQNHYPEYSQAREKLRRSVVEQEEELQKATQLVMTRVPLPPGGEQRRLEVARAFLAKCSDRGPGMTLTPTATEDEREAFEVFASFQPDTEVTAHCQSLKRRAAGISSSARKLSTEARALAERTTLPGECKYTRLEPSRGG